MAKQTPSASAVLPPSNPTNLVLSEAFGITFVKYPAYTVLPTIAAALAVYILITYVLFASGKQIPKTINTDALEQVPAIPKVTVTDDGSMTEVPNNNTCSDEVTAIMVDENSFAINDKHGAIIGSSLFAITLILLVGLSPINVPVWEITVPPAVVMLMRDIWHDWRHTKNVNTHTVPEAQAHTVPENKHAVNVKEHKTLASIHRSYKRRLPTVSTVISRLPVACVLFAFCMFILVEGLTTHGWVEVFAGWWAAWIRACLKAGVGSAVVGATGMMLLLSIILCNVSVSFNIDTI